jgi:hypothetical protein
MHGGWYAPFGWPSIYNPYAFNPYGFNPYGFYYNPFAYSMPYYPQQFYGGYYPTPLLQQHHATGAHVGQGHSSAAGARIPASMRGHR